jgi:hypothetical protein
MSSLPAQTVPVFCTDEDLLVRASGDYITLVPSWQCMARAQDGVIAPGNLWVITSASINFLSNGVAPNQVIALLTPKPQYPGGGDMLAIDSVSSDGHSLTLRRPHKELGIGMPPSPPSGVTGIGFTILTFDPQIEEASFSIKRAYGIDENLPLRTSTWMYDLRDVRMLCVLTVLYDRYTSELRSDRGDWVRKMGHIRNLRDEVASRVEIRWGPNGNSQEPTTIFSCHLSR